MALFSPDICFSSWWTGSEKWKAHEFTKDDQQAVKLAAKCFRPLQGESKPWTLKPIWQTLSHVTQALQPVAQSHWASTPLFTALRTLSLGDTHSSSVVQMRALFTWEKNIFKSPLIPPNFLSVYDPASLYFSSRPMAKVEVGEEGNYCFILVAITQSTRHFTSTFSLYFPLSLWAKHYCFHSHFITGQKEPERNDDRAHSE